MKEEENKVLLKRHGLKVTPVRLEILNTFNQNSMPLDAETLFNELSLGDKATAYRTLSIFEEKGIIKRVDIRKSSVHYERVDSHHHHHIVCTSCGYIEDFKDCAIEGILDSVTQKTHAFTSITDHSIELFGLCNSCSHA